MVSGPQLIRETGQTDAPDEKQGRRGVPSERRTLPLSLNPSPPGHRHTVTRNQISYQWSRRFSIGERASSCRALGALRLPRVPDLHDLLDRGHTDPLNHEEVVGFKRLELSPRFDRGPAKCIVYTRAEGVAVDLVVRDRLGVLSPLELAACNRTFRHGRPTRSPPMVHHRGRSSAIASISTFGSIKMAVATVRHALDAPHHRLQWHSISVDCSCLLDVHTWSLDVVGPEKFQKTSRHLHGRT
jgi:hypothetical protein